jgi:diguanylate cyclase (GGDEF)-like protein
MKGRSHRSIVSRVLLMHVLWVFGVYLLIAAGLWWVSTSLIENNLQKQAVQWVAELDTLGTPLYVSKNSTQGSQFEARLQNFPEVAYVRYYNAQGTVLGEYTANKERDVPVVTPEQLEQLASLAGTERPYLFDDTAADNAYVRLLYPVTIKFMRPDNMFNLDLHDRQQEKIKIIGHIDLGMDLGHYREYLLKLLVIGSVVIGLMILLSLIFGRYMIKKALAPLTDLQEPLARLARGDIDVLVESSGDEEIIAISNALNATISALKQRDRALREMADHDSLTGLVNRACFIQQLDDELLRIAHGNRSSAILFIDLDQFKYVNDTLGHAAGDRLLIQVTALLKARMREQDVISRFGGDEFTILARNVTKASALGIAKTINELMRNFHFLENGQSFNIYCSIGISMIDSDDFHAGDLIAQADIACHQAKRRGRNRLHMHEHADQDRQRMEVDVSWSQLINKALREDSFVLYYQPIIDLSGAGAEFYEVLLRMPGANGELELPSAFLPAAARFGLMLDIDRWVIAHAIEALARLRAAGRDITLSVNLSAQSFEENSVLRHIEDSLRQHNLPAQALILEITEQMAIRHLDRTREFIQSLLDVGCRFALDDFGAGFSSFSNLKNLPVDYIKISQPFIENLATDSVDQAMVKSIIQIARALGRLTVAEYVQDARTIELLREFGVDYAQGNYIDKAADHPRMEIFQRYASEGRRRAAQG